MSSLRSSWPKYNEAYLKEEYSATKTADCRWKNYDLDSFINKDKPNGLNKYPVIDIIVGRLHEKVTKIRRKSKQNWVSEQHPQIAVIFDHFVMKIEETTIPEKERIKASL